MCPPLGYFPADPSELVKPNQRDAANEPVERHMLFYLLVRCPMVAFLMVGIILVLAFLCLSTAIPGIIRSKPAAGSLSAPASRLKSKK
jgi:hypothetical protein